MLAASQKNVSEGLVRAGKLRVAVVGLGALGNEVMKALALTGVRRFVLIDPDLVERHNGRNSLFYQGVAAGTWKVDAMQTAIRRWFRDVESEVLACEVADAGWGKISRCDLMFGCVDRDSARLEMARIATRLNVPVCDGGLGGEHLARGRVSYFAPGAACFCCRLPATSRRAMLRDWSSASFSCSVLNETRPMRSSTATMAGITGSAMVEIALQRYFTGATESSTSEFLFDGPVRAETFTVARSEACPFHEEAGRPLIPVPGTFAEAAEEVSWEWAQCVRARCRQCGHEWPLGMRLVSVAKSARCPRCKHRGVEPREVLVSVRRGSEWSEKTPRDLGLPDDHRYTVVSP